MLVPKRSASINKINMRIKKDIFAIRLFDSKNSFVPFNALDVPLNISILYDKKFRYVFSTIIKK